MNETGMNNTSLQIDEPITQQVAGGAVRFLCPNCKVLAVLLYSCLSLVAFVGNSLILSVFVYFRRLRTPTNMLIANLAIADLMISILCMPLSYWHVVIFEDQRWVFGPFLCKLFNYLQATAVFLSSWTLVAISFDRFMAIMFVMSPWMRIGKRKALYAILITWLFSLFMALPLLIVNQTEPSPADPSVDLCMEKWGVIDLIGDEEFIVHTYTSLVFALQYCLPLLVLLITYTCIGLKMWNSKVPGEQPLSVYSSVSAQQRHRLSSFSSVTVTGHQPAHSQHQSFVNKQLDRRHESVKKVRKWIGRRGKRAQARDLQLIPMVLLVSALYAGCWLPQNLLMNIWVTYDPSVTSHPYILYIWWGSHTLAMFHSIVNPFIYYNQNKRFHEAVNLLLIHFLPPWLPCVRADLSGASQRQQSQPFNSAATGQLNNHNKAQEHYAMRRGNNAAEGASPGMRSSIRFGAQTVRISNTIACTPAVMNGREHPAVSSVRRSIIRANSTTQSTEI